MRNIFFARTSVVCAQKAILNFLCQLIETQGAISILSSPQFFPFSFHAEPPFVASIFCISDAGIFPDSRASASIVHSR